MMVVVVGWMDGWIVDGGGCCDDDMNDGDDRFFFFWFFVGASKSRTHFNLPKFNNNHEREE